MNLLLEASVRFPTVIFTIGLGIVLVYWLFVLLGALDLDLLGGADAAGAGKGAGEAIGDMITGGAKGGAEGLKGLKPDADGGGMWKGLGLAQVPVTISLSVILLVAWVASLLGMQHARPAIGSLGGWFPGLLLVTTIVVSVLVASVIVRPLAPLFAIHGGKTNRDYVGHTCTITTGSVDENFGQANLEDGGTVLVIPVRCDKPGSLRRGSRALVIDFDDVRNAYVVEPQIDMLPAPEDRT